MQCVVWNKKSNNSNLGKEVLIEFVNPIIQTSESLWFWLVTGIWEKSLHYVTGSGRIVFVAESVHVKHFKSVNEEQRWFGKEYIFEELKHKTQS
jgi:hypothetical protein